MKKWLMISLMFVLMLVLGACSQATTEEKEETPKAEAEGATQETAESTEEKVPKVAFVYIGVPSDGGWTKTHDEGRELVDSTFGIKSTTVENVPEGPDAERIIEELAQDHNIIFTTSYGYMDPTINVAKKYPDVVFLHATGYKTADNVGTYQVKGWEASYLAGTAAGSLTEKAEMGYVGAFTYAEVISGYTSFYLGAKSVCPSVTMEVTFTGSWYDETAEKEAANKLINNGCVLISQHADSMGAPTACETAGVPDVSYNGSTASACPNTFIVSSRIDWVPYFEYAIKCVAEGKAIDADWTGTLATGSVVLTDINEQAAAAGTQAKIDEVKAALEAGTTHVFDITTFTVEGKTLDSYMADVDTDEAYTGDTEVIADGYFHESEYRSAPYFDVQIDGITLLDTQF